MELIQDRIGKSIWVIEAESCLLREDSPYQRIELFVTEQYGKVLVLDSSIQTTEKDEFFYHEMLVQPAMHIHPQPEDILIVGGGDGGTLEEVLKHNPKTVTMVEIDRRVVEVSREYLTSINKAAFDKDNVELVFEDAFKYVQDIDRKYDVIFIDCSDPIGPGRVLYTPDFYQAVRNRLKEEGIVVVQSESPVFQVKEHNMVRGSIREVFGDRFYPYLGLVPSYPGGLWSYILVGPSLKDIRRMSKQEGSIPDLKYYAPQPQLHENLFTLPKWYIERYSSV